MESDYREQLDAASLRLLAETTGFGTLDDSSSFQSRPHDIKVALGSPQAARLLDLRRRNDPVQHHLLQLAVAVHQTANDICQAGWVATDESVIDLSLLSFSGQTEHHRFVVGLLASYLQPPVPPELDGLTTDSTACTTDRLRSLIDLAATASPAERPGALRLLGDEALFTAGVFPGVGHRAAVDADLLDALCSALPKAVVALMDELRPQLRNLLDVYLMFGPVWYRMAAQNIQYSTVRSSLSSVAAEFPAARRFIVQVAQGPLANIKHDLYPAIA